MDGLRFVLGKVRFGLHVVELEEWEDVERDGYVISAVPVRHRIDRLRLRAVEDAAAGPLRRRAGARAQGVTPGPDFGRLQRGETVNGVAPEEVIGPDRPGRKIVLSGDTAPCETLRVAAHEADLLVHEATFTEEERDRARDTSHSTAHQAATLADEAEVRLLALTHLSTRYGGREIRDEARLDLREHDRAARLRRRRDPVPREGPADRAPPRRRARSGLEQQRPQRRDDLVGLPRDPLPGEADDRVAHDRQVGGLDRVLLIRVAGPVVLRPVGLDDRGCGSARRSRPGSRRCGR